MAALVKDNNTLTLLDLRLGYTLREPSTIVQRQILLCRGYASATQYLGELLRLAADLLFSLLMSTHCLYPFHGGVCFLPKTGLVLQRQKRQLSSSLTNSCKATHTHTGTQLSAVSLRQAQLVLTPYKFGVPTLMFMN